MNLRAAAIAVLVPLLCAAPRNARGTDWDPRVQGAIQRVARAADADGHARALAALADLEAAGRARLVRQLFLFGEAARDTRDAMVFGALVERYGWTADEVVGPLVPLLDGADAERRAALARVFAHYEGRTLTDAADFTVFRPHLAGGANEAVVRHVVEADPASAVALLSGALPVDPTRARELASDAAALDRTLRAAWFGAGGRDAAPDAAGAAALARLAAGEHWWARLAAARAAREGKGLAAAATIDLLDADPHPFVREAARRVTRR